MYLCRIQFYLLGRQCRTFDIIRNMPAFEHFEHEFLESDEPKETLAAFADVIVINLQDVDLEEILRMLAANRKQGAEVILLTDENQKVFLEDNISVFNDIWKLPMSEAEIRFRFLRWQQTYKMSKDFWQTSQFLDATINNIPNLV